MPADVVQLEDSATILESAGILYYASGLHCSLVLQCYNIFMTDAAVGGRELFVTHAYLAQAVVR